jgi:hypothetical protein
MSHYYFHELGSSSSYLTSYPYLLSGPLHTYAGLLSFYLAQPPSNLAKNASTSTTLTPRNHIDGTQPSEINSAQSVSSRSDTSTVRPSTKSIEPPNPILVRQARAYFVKALAIDETDVVAGEFIENVSHCASICAGPDIRSIIPSRLALGVLTSPEMMMMVAKARAMMMSLSMGRIMRRKKTRVMTLARIWKLLWEQYPTKTMIHEIWMCSWICSWICSSIHN